MQIKVVVSANDCHLKVNRAHFDSIGRPIVAADEANKLIYIDEAICVDTMEIDTEAVGEATEPSDVGSSMLSKRGRGGYESPDIVRCKRKRAIKQMASLAPGSSVPPVYLKIPSLSILKTNKLQHGKIELSDISNNVPFDVVVYFALT